MTEAPKQFPTYPQGVPIAHPKQAKPMMKLMSRALRGKLGKGKLFQPTHKRKKPRVI